MTKSDKARRLLRRSVTQLLTEINQELQSQEPSIQTLRFQLESINKKFDQLRDLDAQALNTLLEKEDATDSEIDEEQKAIDSYEKTYFDARASIETFFESKRPPASPTKSVSSVTESESLVRKRFKLPKFKIKKFDGDLKQWLGFWAQFEKIHLDPTIDESDKFNCLFDSTIVGSKAREAIEGYPQSAANYPLAVAKLKRRFGQEKVLQRVYVRELLKLVNVGGKEKGTTLQFFVKLDNHLRALETLGVTGMQTSTFLYPMVESSLPEDLMTAWQRSGNYGRDGSKANPPKSELQFLMDFLRQEAEHEEQRNLARDESGVATSNKKSVKVDQKVTVSSPKEEVPKAAGLFSGTGKPSLSCIFCEKPHDSQQCFKAQSMSLEEKKDCILAKKACLQCLKFDHQAKGCKSFTKCLVCSKKHLTLMCPEIPSNKIKGKSEKTTEATQSALSNLNWYKEVVLQTLIVKVKVKGKDHNMRAMIDTGSQRSYILKKKALDLGLNPTGSVRLQHILFGCSTECRDHVSYEIALENLNGKFRQNLSVLDQDGICANIPRVSKGPWMKELKAKGIWISDIGRGAPEIDLLLGADIYGHLLTGRVEPLKDGLVAIETTLGWTLIGRKEERECSLAMAVSSMLVSEAVVEFQEFKQEATKILAEAKMELRQWGCTLVEGPGIGSSTDDGCGLGPGESHESTSTPVLGMTWNTVNDTLSCAFQVKEETPKVTKRLILSSVQQIFDPIGFMCPVLLLPKLLLQETWTSKIGWDVELPVEVSSKFLRWWEELPSITDIKVPRQVTGNLNPQFLQLHCFCDASKTAYASVVYLTSVSASGTINVQLLQAKSRVSPLKPLTIPRLELMACVIGSRLTSSVNSALDLDSVVKVYWTDSTTALSWIQRNNNWGTFIGNRVRNVLDLSKSAQWRYVPGPLNPADLPSRGCSAKELQLIKWWEGPDWLRSEEEQWPIQNFTPNEDLINSELKKCTVISSVNLQSDSSSCLLRFEYFKRNVKVMANLLRFFQNCRKKKVDRETGPLSISELEIAERRLFQIIQKEAFPECGDICQKIQVVRDEDNLLRVKSRLLHREDSLGFRLPVLLPNSHRLVDQLIWQTHLDNGHGGVQFVIGKLREKYWILQCRRAVRKVIFKCVKCRRFSSKPIKSDTGFPSLPEERVKTAKVFETTGIDLPGPLYLKTGEKVYIMLATCAVYRAIHLELLSSLSTEAFLLGFRRFIDRRGRPVTVFSDNGTNFCGAENLFATLDWNVIQKDFEVKRIQWKFIPPGAPWWGGFWERLVRSVKDILKRIIGKGVLNFEQLHICVCDAEAIVNSRPLTVVTEDPQDLIPLTPSMFLQEITEVQFPEVEVIKGTTKLSANFRQLTRVREELKSRFRKEYLSLLIQRGKEKPYREVKVGDIVFIGSEDKKRIQWPLALVIGLVSGKDGVVRVAELKTAHGVTTRPLNRLFLTEVNCDFPIPIQLQKPCHDVAQAEKERESEEEPEETTIVQRTRSGRQIRRPQRYSD